MKIKKNKIIFRCDNHKYVEYTLSDFFKRYGVYLYQS